MPAPAASIVCCDMIETIIRRQRAECRSPLRRVANTNRRANHVGGRHHADTAQITGWRPQFDLAGGRRKNVVMVVLDTIPRRMRRKPAISRKEIGNDRSAELFSLVVPVLNEEDVLDEPMPN